MRISKNNDNPGFYAFARLFGEKCTSIRGNCSDLIRIYFVVPAELRIFQFVMVFFFSRQCRLEKIEDFRCSFLIIFKNITILNKYHSYRLLLRTFYNKITIRKKPARVNNGRTSWKQNMIRKIKFKFDFNLKTNKVFIIYSGMMGKS